MCCACLHKCAQHLPPLGCPAPAPWDVSSYFLFRVTISMHNSCQHLAALHLFPELCLHLCAVPACISVHSTCHPLAAQPLLPGMCLLFLFRVTISMHNTCQHMAALHLHPEQCLHVCVQCQRMFSQYLPCSLGTVCM